MIRYIKYSLQETYDLSIGHLPDALSKEVIWV